MNQPADQDRGPQAPLRRTVALARPAAGRLALATLLGAGAVAAGIGLLGTSAWLISRAAQHPRQSSLALAIVAVQFFGISRGLFRYGERLVGHDAAFRLLADLRVRVYERLERLAPVGLPAFRRADLMARLVHDVDSMQDLLLRVIPPYAIAALVGAVTVGLVWWMLPAAGLILLAALLLAATVLPWLTKRLARRSETVHATVRGHLTASVVDVLEGAPDLLAYGATELYLTGIADADAALTRVARAAATTSGVGLGLATLSSGLAMWGALLVGVPAVASGKLDGVLLAVLALIPLAAFELVTPLPTATQTLERVRRSASRVFAVTDAPATVLEPVVPAPVPPPPHSVQIRGLRARYPGSGSLALDGVDFDLAPGRRVAVVGPSGAGKTTLAMVLLRFLDYESGAVTLGTVELDTLDGDDARRVIGLLAQDAHVFDTTLAENLRVAKREATDDELARVLRRVGLLDWVDRLPAHLDTELGEHGAGVSGGERQRLALARALLADFPVLVLDEPVEHLDVRTADAITADLLDATRDRTTLYISHRLAGLDAVDEIVVLDGGRVVERGTHGELLRGDGRYAELWRRECELRPHRMLTPVPATACIDAATLPLASKGRGRET